MSYQFGLGLSNSLPVAVHGRVAGNEVGNVFFLVSLEVEATLLLRTAGTHVECDSIIHNVYSHALQLGILILRHDLGMEVSVIVEQNLQQQQLQSCTLSFPG